MHCCCEAGIKEPSESTPLDKQTAPSHASQFSVPGLVAARNMQFGFRADGGVLSAPTNEIILTRDIAGPEIASFATAVCTSHHLTVFQPVVVDDKQQTPPPWPPHYKVACSCCGDNCFAGIGYCGPSWVQTAMQYVPCFLIWMMRECTIDCDAVIAPKCYKTNTFKNVFTLPGCAYFTFVDKDHFSCHACCSPAVAEYKRVVEVDSSQFSHVL